MANNVSWPAAFEDHLHALPPESLCRLLDEYSKQKKEPTSPRRSGRGAQLNHHHHQGLMPADGQLCTTPFTMKVPSQPSSNMLPSHISSKAPNSVVSEPRPQVRRDYLQFHGSGQDYGPFHCTGILHNLPTQFGIPGWQRVTMMKYFVEGGSASVPSPSSSSQPSSSSSSSSSFPPSATSSAGSSNSSASSTAASGVSNPSNATGNPFGYGNGDDDDDDQQFVLDEHCWCYEGVVLPGGKIILGRWWQPLEEGEEMRCLGPFIFWNVP